MRGRERCAEEEGRECRERMTCFSCLRESGCSRGRSVTCGCSFVFAVRSGQARLRGREKGKEAGLRRENGSRVGWRDRGGL